MLPGAAQAAAAYAKTAPAEARAAAVGARIAPAGSQAAPALRAVAGNWAVPQQPFVPAAV